MLHELAEFLIRPSRKPGESLAGFVSRHFGTNGHMIPKALHDAIAKIYRSDNAEDREAAWELVCKVIGTASTEDRRMWFEERFTLGRIRECKTRRYWQKPSTRQFVICAECLREHNIHMALWDLPLVFACPVHQCLLATRCSCQKPLKWATTAPSWTCQCGQPITSIKSKPASRSLINLSMAIVSASKLNVPGLSEVWPARFTVGTDLLTTYDVLAWLHELVLTVPMSISASPRSQMGLKSWEFGRAIERYPAGLQEWLARLAGRIHRHDQDQLFVFLDDAHPTFKLMARLYSAAESETLPQQVSIAAATALQGLEFSSGTRCRWIFNPALKLVQKTQKAQALQSWWKGLTPWLRFEKDVSLIATRTPSLKDTEERTCVLVLNMLCRAAKQPDSYKEFRQFALVWPPISEHAAELPASQYLEMLAVQLRSISDAHRSHLSELASQASCLAVGIAK